MSPALRTAASVFRRVPPMGPFLFGRKGRAARIEPSLDRAANDAGTACYDVDRILAAAREAPQLTLIEWEGEDPAGLVPGAASIATEAWTPPTPDRDPRGRKIRDRYVRARFPGVVRATPDLESAQSVVKASRLYFEDGDIELALELLDCALEENPRNEPVWLARLEIVFLARDAAGFTACARAFQAAHPASEAWEEVSRLGRALAPGEALFGPASGPREHEHYGPWPHLPNWIQASWDLTAEVSAADFHRAMAQRAARAQTNPSNDPA